MPAPSVLALISIGGRKLSFQEVICHQITGVFNKIVIMFNRWKVLIRVQESRENSISE